MRANVYDFDKTILPYDSTAAFYRRCARRYPRGVKASLPCLPKAALYAVGLCGKTAMKDAMYAFLRYVPDVDAEVAAFWDERFDDISRWYLDDIIISASPEFLLRPVAERLGVRLIASRVGKYTGVTEGRNNDGEEKVRRLRAEYPDTEIAQFYSDSLHDAPLARLAERAWLVRAETPLPWPEK